MSQSLTAVVLLVEDEAIVRMNTSDILSDLGYTVIEAANADRAIEILAERNDIAVVFTDINMPGSMDGLKLARAVRDRWPPVKIIVTSGFIDPEELEIPLGGRFIAKPYAPQHLKAVLRELLS